MLLIAVYFWRLKIIHDLHEFILESGTIANSSDSFFRYTFSPLDVLLLYFFYWIFYSNKIVQLKIRQRKNSALLWPAAEVE